MSPGVKFTIREPLACGICGWDGTYSEAKSKKLPMKEDRSTITEFRCPDCDNVLDVLDSRTSTELMFTKDNSEFVRFVEQQVSAFVKNLPLFPRSACPPADGPLIEPVNITTDTKRWVAALVEDGSLGFADTNEFAEESVRTAAFSIERDYKKFTSPQTRSFDVNIIRRKVSTCPQKCGWSGPLETAEIQRKSFKNTNIANLYYYCPKCGHFLRVLPENAQNLEPELGTPTIPYSSLPILFPPAKKGDNQLVEVVHVSQDTRMRAEFLVENDVFGYTSVDMFAEQAIRNNTCYLMIQVLEKQEKKKELMI